MAKIWKHAMIEVPSVTASERAPDQVQAGRAVLHVLSERSLEGAFWGPDARRRAVEWEHSGTEGKGYVEFRPLSSSTSDIVLHLESPAGIGGKLAWTSRRLGAHADALVQTLRDEIAANTKPVRARARRSA